MTAAHPDNEPDERKERRRRIFKHLVELVLLYHVSPGSKTIPEILDSSTLGTALPISLDKKTPTFRVHVGRPSLIPPGHVKLNFFSTLRKRPVLAKNGVIYIIEGHPLLPPLTPLSEMFLFPDVFSTLTSAIQQIGLDGLLLPHYDNKPIHANFGDYGDEDTVDERVMLMLREIAEEKSKLSKRSFTIFAPSNRAFKKLGWGANAAIFSPFARGLLHHVLSYHVVPDLVFHTDHIDNTAASLVTGADVDVDLGGTYDNFESWNWNGLSGSPINAPEALTKPGKVNVTHFELPTLLGSRDNETLAVDVAQYRLHWGNGPIVRRVVVKPPPFCGKPQHPIPALVADLPAWGGAIHIIGDVIKPPISGHPICKHIREGH